MKMPLRALVPFVLTLASIPLFMPQARAEGPCDDLHATEPRKADLECLGRWIDTEQSWPGGMRERAKEQLAALSEQAASLDDIAFYLRAAALVAMPDNGHTGLSRSPIYRRFGLLPIRTYWFEDGLYIVRAAPEEKELLGAKVLKIAGQTPTELMAKMQAYFGGPDEAFRVYGHTAYFLSPALLHGAGVAPSSDTLSLELSMASGEIRTVELSTFAASEKHPVARMWRQLHPEPLEGEGQGWITWLGESGVTIPWAYDDVGEVFRYRYLSKRRVSHIQLRVNTDADEANIRDFLEDLEKRLQRDRPTYLLWDQRQNSGGDLSKTASFARKLHKWLPEDGHVFVLTSNATFSAGIYTSFFPEWVDEARTTVIGTRVGDRERFWAETGPAIVLPETGWQVFHSLQMHDLGQGCDDRDLCHIRRKKWKIKVGSFDPDNRIPETSSDLLAGRDRVVDWALGEVEARIAAKAGGQ